MHLSIFYLIFSSSFVNQLLLSDVLNKQYAIAFMLLSSNQRYIQVCHQIVQTYIFTGFANCLISLSEEILKLFDALPLSCTRLTLLEKLFMFFLSFITYMYLWLLFFCTIVLGARNNQYSILLSCSCFYQI